MDNSLRIVFCHLDHSLSSEIGAVSCRDVQDEDKASIDVRFYTMKYIEIMDPRYGFIRKSTEKASNTWIFRRIPRTDSSRRRREASLQRSCTSRRWFRAEVSGDMQA